MKNVNFAILIIGILTVSSCKNVDDRSPLQTEDLSAKNESVSKHPELYKLILEKDSLLFQIGFNQIDTSLVAALISEDFEFYHDEHGIMKSKEAFLSSIAGLRELPFKTWRTLIAGSVEIFPLYSDEHSKLYGIIQTDMHEFYQKKNNEEARKTSTARFNHLWIKENDEWKLKRVLSYDHINSN